MRAAGRAEVQQLTARGGATPPLTCRLSSGAAATAACSPSSSGSTVRLSTLEDANALQRTLLESVPQRSSCTSAVWLAGGPGLRTAQCVAQRRIRAVVRPRPAGNAPARAPAHARRQRTRRQRLAGSGLRGSGRAGGRTRRQTLPPTRVRPTQRSRTRRGFPRQSSRLTRMAPSRPFRPVLRPRIACFSVGLPTPSSSG